MTISFNYKTVKRPDGTEVRTPSIPIVLFGKESFETVALLDSSADLSAIPKDIAEILGLDLSGTHSTAYGIGGKTDALDTTMGILVEKGHEKYTFRIPVKVIMDPYDFPILLGRAGFFDQFIISFNELQEKVSLKRFTGRTF